MRALESSRVPGRNAFNVRAYDAFMDRHMPNVSLWVSTISLSEYLYLCICGSNQSYQVEAQLKRRQYKQTVPLCVCGSKQFNRIYIAGCHLSY